MEVIELTLKGKKELEERLDVLKNDLIPQVVQRIKIARELGDLSENAEYHSAKDEQGKLNGEKVEIENILKNCVVVEKSNNGLIDIGTKLTYLDIDEEEEFTITIVSTAEADFENGKISKESPVGNALFGKKEGETVGVKMPNGGEYQIKVIKIFND